MRISDQIAAVGDASAALLLFNVNVGVNLARQSEYERCPAWGGRGHRGRGGSERQREAEIIHGYPAGGGRYTQSGRTIQYGTTHDRCNGTGHKDEDEDEGEEGDADEGDGGCWTQPCNPCLEACAEDARLKPFDPRPSLMCAF
ncbi:hypothetical protein KEM56_006993 [Ascosphaera pollenicola]|nr:hypothetical protein KEM56_006993 [Ascosphaera pollenicola]